MAGGCRERGIGMRGIVALPCAVCVIGKRLVDEGAGIEHAGITPQ